MFVEVLRTLIGESGGEDDAPQEIESRLTGRAAVGI
jgi:hypothetical protein